MSFDLSKIGGVPCRMDQECPFGALCTFRHGDETKEQAQKRQQAAYMAKKAAANGGGGGGGPASPPRVPRVVPAQAPWAPARVPTYAQKAQPNPEMPGWMIEGKKLESEFNMIAEAEAAYKLVVETAIATKKAAETAAQKAYKAALEKAGGGGKKSHVPVGLTDQIGSFADEAADSDEE
jgi:hypothetical protein